MTLKLDFTVDQGSFKLQAALELPARGVTALFGRSGSGKTTLLRCIAGLKRQPGGYLKFKDQTWQQDHFFLPTWKRSLGYVFQEASLFPHLRVMQNLEYGYRRVAADKRRIQPAEVIELLNLAPLLQRYPDEISGGQRQRVSLGRALLTSPELMLMDEPLASLDATSKAEILPYLERLHGELEMPILYVSHSIEEVIRLADQLVLIDDGQVRAQGELRALLTRHDLPFARTEYSSAVLHARVQQAESAEGVGVLAVAGQTLLTTQQLPAVGKTVRVRVMARDVGLALQPPTGTSILNCLRVTLVDTGPGLLPGQLLVRLQLGDQLLLARVSSYSARLLGLHPGQPLYALIKGVALS